MIVKMCARAILIAHVTMSALAKQYAHVRVIAHVTMSALVILFVLVI